MTSRLTFISASVSRRTPERDERVPRAANPRFHRSNADAERSCNLRVRHVLYGVQEKRLPVAAGHRLQTSTGLTKQRRLQRMFVGSRRTVDERIFERNQPSGGAQMIPV